MLTSALVLTALLAADDGSNNPNRWEEISSNEGLTIWTRDIPGARVREVRAQSVVAAPPKRVWEVLSDLEHYTEFMPYVEETIKVTSLEGGHIEYQRIDPPLVDRRDYTLKVSLVVDEAKGTYRREWVEANDKGPPVREGTVRVAINRGAWTVEALPDGKSRLSYYLYTDPGGSLPAWIANKANTKSVPDLMSAVKNRSLDQSWRR